MNENGLTEYWGRKYTKGIMNPKPCMLELQKPIGKAKILTLEGMSSAFIILGIGYTLSIFAFALEITTCAINKRISQRKNQPDSP